MRKIRNENENKREATNSFWLWTKTHLSLRSQRVALILNSLASLVMCERVSALSV